MNDTRQIYQQDGDLSLVIEAQVMDLFLQSFAVPSLGTPLTADKLPIAYHVDFAVSAPRQFGKPIVGYVEIKGRNQPHTAFDTWFISLNKFLHGTNLASLCNCPLWLIYAWQETIWYCPVNRTKLALVSMGGNLKRADGKGDWEPMAHFRRSDFQYLGSLDSLRAKSNTVDAW